MMDDGRFVSNDLGIGGVKKINSVNVKKIPLFECDGNIKSKNEYSIRTSFGIFRE